MARRFLSAKVVGTDRFATKIKLANIRPEDLNEIAIKSATKIKNRFIEERLEKYEPDHTPGLHQRSGKIARSLRFHIQGGKDKKIIKMRIGDGSTPYVNIQETGGTITPRNSKYLAIPLGSLRNELGPPGSKSLLPLRGWASPSRSPLAGRLKYHRSKNSGNLFLAAKLSDLPPAVLSKARGYTITRTENRKRGEKDNLVLLYILKRSVHIPGTLGFNEFFTSKDVRKTVNADIQGLKRTVRRRYSRGK